MFYLYHFYFASSELFITDITPQSVLLTHSYLTDRLQFVEFNSYKSTYLPISTGSVLGPLLFLIYINDLPLMSNIFSMLMYVDDTTLYCNIDQYVNEDVINVELAKLSEWLRANKLALNISKTKFMVFHTSNRAVQYPNLKINNTDIEHVFEFNFLGVMFNSQMNWNTHINYIASKISRTVGLLYRLKDIYPQSVLLTLYNTLILPHFHYCLLLWGSSIKENHPLYLLQKKAVRIIDNSHYIAHTEPICKVHRLLKHELPNEFVWNNHVITDMNEIANEFNRYFISIGQSLSEKIQSVHSSEEYLGQKANSVFKFTAVNEDCIDKIVKKLKSKSSTGYDNISNILIKHARTILVKPLTLLANQIIHTGEFPRQLKIARVKPLYKKGDQSSFSNYHPISLLPSISKIFENVMAAQLMDYFTTNNLFCIQQFGFRPGHSTELAALKLANHLIAELDNCKIPTNIYIDLSKAFDTLNFDILLKKLEHYGINESAKRLIHSYLTDRFQFVEFNRYKSTYLPISTGVPQGSVLGPLLFLIYINDLPLMSNIFSMLMYADDTTLHCNIDQHVNENDIHVELAKLSEWLGANKLALNISKTKFMVFHTSNKAVKYPNLKINSTDIEQVFEFNFLGVMFNSQMNWNTHINYIASKISRTVGILYRLKDIYPQSVLLTLYNTLILPHFHYCLLLWGSSIKENHPLHMLQKKAVRIIDNSHYIAHTEPICKVHRLLKLPDMFSIALWKFYHKLMNNKLPECFSTIKPKLPEILEHYEIRNPVFHLPAIKHKFEENCNIV